MGNPATARDPRVFHVAHAVRVARARIQSAITSGAANLHGGARQSVWAAPDDLDVALGILDNAGYSRDPAADADAPAPPAGRVPAAEHDGTGYRPPCPHHYNPECPACVAAAHLDN